MTWKESRGENIQNMKYKSFFFIIYKIQVAKAMFMGSQIFFSLTISFLSFFLCERNGIFLLLFWCTVDNSG